MSFNTLSGIWLTFHVANNWRWPRSMTLLGNAVRTSEQGEKSLSWRSMNGMRCHARAASFLLKTLIAVSHASFAPFVPSERIMFFLSGHLDRISQQSHQLGPYTRSGADTNI